MTIAVMRKPILLGWAVVVLSGLTAFAERPPPAGKAPAEFYATPSGAEGPSPGARFLATLPFEARDKLRKDGKVVLELKRKQGYVHAVIRLERPIDEAFAIITRPSAQARYMPHVAQSKTVSGRTEEGESIDYVVAVLFVKFPFRLQHWFYPEQQRMEWTLDPTGKNSLEQQSGFLQLYELDAKTTIAELSASVTVKNDFVAFIRSLGQKGEVSDVLAAMRKYVGTANLPHHDPTTEAP